MDFTNVSVNEFIKYFIRQNRKRFGYDWYDDRKQSPQTTGFVFEHTDKRIYSATTAKPETGRAEAARKADTGSSGTEELEIW